MLLLVSCGGAAVRSAPPHDSGKSFADAVNSNDIEAAMAHWSEGAVLYIQSGGSDAVAISRAEIRANYERLFESSDAPKLEIRVDRIEQVGDSAHEWGSFKMGESVGCYVIFRRAIDDWKIYREWIVDPCGT